MYCSSTESTNRRRDFWILADRGVPTDHCTVAHHSSKCAACCELSCTREPSLHRPLLRNCGSLLFCHLYTFAPQNYYLRQGGNVFAGFCLFVCLFVCLSVCLCVSKITRKVIDGSFWNFEGMSGMAQATSDSILGVIRKKSWILNHFQIFVTIALKGA